MMSKNDFIKTKPSKKIGQAVGPDGELLPESDADFIETLPSKKIDLDPDEAEFIKTKPGSLSKSGDDG